MDDRVHAEKMLKYLCVGSQLEGLGFFGPKVYLWNSDIEIEETYINIEADFCILNSMSQARSIGIDNFPKADVTESLKSLCELGQKSIIDIVLSPHNHLIVHFETADILIVCGYSEVYECWQVGSSNGDWLVVACPGTNFAIWAPDNWVSLIKRN